MKKSKSVFALSVAGATFASAIGFASPAGAVNYVYNNVTYDVTNIRGSFNSLKPILTAADNVLWANASPSFALELAKTVGFLGGGNGNFCFGVDNATCSYGPLYAYDYRPSDLNEPGDTRVFVMSAFEIWYGGGGFGYTPQDVEREDILYAKATVVAVPWELSGSATIFGSITGIALGIGLKRLKGKISKKEE